MGGFLGRFTKAEQPPKQQQERDASKDPAQTRSAQRTNSRSRIGACTSTNTGATKTLFAEKYQNHSELEGGYCYIGIYDHDVGHSGDTTGIESKVKAVFVKAVEKATEQGHLYAQMEIAEFYYSGTGVPVNYEKAFEWSTKASRRRDATPEYAL
ncbi:hypothetical protein BKA57DRAFT_510043 [Linnemannia elongata]|nr:hypothetical protein BKA57DRAFT_510043 [Linnemannia elongata]